MTQKGQDQQLLQQIQASYEPAFKMLFEKYYQFLCYAVYKIYPDEHKSKDIAQEVFLDVWKRRETIQIHTSLPAFLKRAARNKTIDYIRSQRFDFEEKPDLGIAPEDPGQKVEHDELKNLIHQTVSELPERCRIVFSMSRFEEMSHKEIAQELGISEKTIENQITKALKILRRVVKRYTNDLKFFLFFYLLL